MAQQTISERRGIATSRLLVPSARGGRSSAMAKHLVRDAGTYPLSVSTYPTAAVVSKIRSMFLGLKLCEVLLAETTLQGVPSDE